jgi:hypothetical protein
MMTDDAAGRGTRDRMMARDMSGHGSDGSPFDTALRLNQAGQCGQGGTQNQARKLMAHGMNSVGVAFSVRPKRPEC